MPHSRPLIRLFSVLMTALLAAVLSPNAAAQFFPGFPGMQAAAVPVEGQSSPRETVTRFLDGYRQWRATGDTRARDRAFACLDMTEMDRVLFGDARLEIPLRLGQLLDHFQVERRLADIPDAAALAAAPADAYTLKVTRGMRTEGFELVKGSGDAWRFSARTLAQLELLHADVFDEQGALPLLIRGAGLGVLVDRTFIGLPIYKWAGLFVILIIGVGVDMLVRWAARSIAARSLLHRQHDAGAGAAPGASGSGPGSHSVAGGFLADADLVKRTARPFGLVVAAASVYWLLPALDLPLTAQSILRISAKAFALFAGVWAAYRVVDLAAEVYKRRPRAGGDPGMEGLLIPLVSRAVKLFILALGLVFIAESLNLPITSLVAGVSLAGAAVAIAAKGTLENIFGTFTVILDKPFRVGDWVKIEQTEGNVEDISFRSTRVRTFDDSLVTIPNSIVMRVPVDNYGMRSRRRFKAVLVLPAATPGEKLEEFCRLARTSAAAHPSVSEPGLEVRVNDFSALGVQVLLIVFFDVTDYAAELKARHEVIVGVLAAGAAAGVQLVSPSSTVGI